MKSSKKIPECHLTLTGSGGRTTPTAQVGTSMARSAGQRLGPRESLHLPGGSRHSGSPRGPPCTSVSTELTSLPCLTPHRGPVFLSEASQGPSSDVKPFTRGVGFRPAVAAWAALPSVDTAVTWGAVPMHRLGTPGTAGTPGRSATSPVSPVPAPP